MRLPGTTAGPTGASPPDAAARTAALDPTRSFIVQAPAGSGKTTLLTQRYLTLLARVPHPEAVLAITFTRKAAAEMRERVMEALARAREGVAPENPADAQTLALAGAALAHDARQDWCLGEHPTRLRIETIDSLNHWLATQLPILSRAGASLLVETRPAELYALAARRTLAAIDDGGALAEELSTVFGHLDAEGGRVEALLATMLAGRDRWLRLVVRSPDGARGAELRRVLEEALATLVAQTLERAAARLPPAVSAELLPLARAAAGRLAPAEPRWQPLARGMDSPLAARAAALPEWQLLAELLLTQKGTWRAALDRSDGFAPDRQAEKAAVQSCIARLRGVPGLEAALADISRLPAAHYDDAQWQVLEALHGVLLAAAARLGEVFAEHGRVDFVAVAQAALQALGTPDQPSDLTLALDYRVQHILLDEFQDTSAAQVTLLERLTAGWQRDDGRTLFLVGDPMQSIYGFRQANVGLFLRIRHAGLGDVALEPLQLLANFRSLPGIVEWVNATFTPVFPATEDLARGAVCYAPSQSDRGPAPGKAVRLHVLPDADAAAEGRCVARLIATERAANPKANIAVLGRTRTQLGAVAAALGAAGTAYQGVELVPLAERLVVRDLVTLTRALTHPGDRIAWLACLRAPWCGLELDALWVLAGEARDQTVWQLIRDERRLAALTAEARVRLARTRTVLDAALLDRGRRSLAALVEAAWVALGGPATVTDASGLDDARTFFARLDTLELACDLEDPVALEEMLADLYAAPDPGATDRLQLLTIHRAKGLEWDVVILTGLGRGSRGGDPQLLRWLEFVRTDGAPGLVLAPHRARAVESDRLEDWLKAFDAERDEIERGRLLYVAATRARDRLHLVTHVRTLAHDADGDDASDGGRLQTPIKGTLLRTLWPALEAEVRAQVRAAESGVRPPDAGSSPRPASALWRLADDWLAPPAVGALPLQSDPPPRDGPSEFEFEWVRAAARHVGTVVHEELERAAHVGLEAFVRSLPTRTAAWRRRLAELGVGDDSLEPAVERVRRALRATVEDERGRWLFDARHGSAASELDLTSTRRGIIAAARIDRTFVDESGVRWIVDFKTSEHEGRDLDGFLDQERARYEPQLERYAELIARRDPGKPIRLGLYFPLHSGWREWARGERVAARPIT